MIWIDLTDLLSWEGNFTGIQRTVYEYAVSYTDTARFFYYDEVNDVFHEIDSDILAKYADAGFTANVSNLNRLKEYKNFLKRFVPNYLLENIPPEQKRKFKNYTKKNAKKILAVKDKFKNRNNQPIDDIKFGKNDVILILGAGWHKEGLTNKLENTKIQNNNLTIICLIYDLIPVYFPQLFGPGMFENYTKYIVKVISCSSVLIAISESTKADILKLCSETGLVAPKVNVIRLGEDIKKSEVIEARKRLVEEDIILTVGTIEARKNHQCLYSAYKYALLTGLKMPKVIIVGRIGWLTSDLIYQIQNDPITKDYIEIRSDVNDEELENLYSKCIFTVYSSVYEGWGLPIAESLSRGKVCIGSNTSSMVEISYDLVEHFSPYNPVELAKKISILFTNKELRKKMETRITEQYRPTTWSESSSRLHELISYSVK